MIEEYFDNKQNSEGKQTWPIEGQRTQRKCYRRRNRLSGFVDCDTRVILKIKWVISICCSKDLAQPVENQSHGCIIYNLKYNLRENQVHSLANARTVRVEDNTTLLDNYPTSYVGLFQKGVFPRSVGLKENFIMCCSKQMFLFLCRLYTCLSQCNKYPSRDLNAFRDSWSYPFLSGINLPRQSLGHLKTHCSSQKGG